jgi:hypothetical protein
MDYVNCIVFIGAPNRDGLASRQIYYWDHDLEEPPTNDVIELSVWQNWFGCMPFIMNSFYTVPKDTLDIFAGRITCTDITDWISELSESYPREW